MRGQLSLMILNFVRNPELHAGLNVGLGPRTGSGV